MPRLEVIPNSRWGRLLEPAARVYAAIASARRRRLSVRAQTVSVPVVSVGNITVGGTGKTPVVELVVNTLLSLGARPAILSRGYGAGGGAVNDEYLVLRANVPDAPHVQSPDRLAAAREVVERGADVVVLDDGFQHVRLARDLDIVLLDATNPFGFGRVLPAGLLREPLDALATADVFVVTRGALVSPDKVRILRWFLARRFPGKAIVDVDFEPRTWNSVDGRSASPIGVFERKRALAFAAIGNPAGFRRQLERLSVDVVDWLEYPDHHRFSSGDLMLLEARARECRAAAVLMTQKDAVKIPPDRPGERIPWRYLAIEPVAGRGAAEFHSTLGALLASARHRGGAHRNENDETVDPS